MRQSIVFLFFWALRCLPVFQARYTTKENRSFFEISTTKNIATTLLFGEVRGFYSNEETDRLLASYKTNFPEIIQSHISIGKTLSNNQTIWALQVAKAFNTSRLSRNYQGEVFNGTRRILENVTNATVAEPMFERILYTDNYTERPTLLITGLHGGSEVVSTSMIMYFIKRLIHAHVNNDTPEADELNFLLETRNIWFIPSINKDTYEVIKETWLNTSILSQLTKNQRNTSCTEAKQRGVNLKLNYPAVKTAQRDTSNCSNTYGGQEGLSEPETQAVSNFLKERRVDLALNLGANRGNIFLPFSYSKTSQIVENDYRDPKDSLLFGYLLSNYHNQDQITKGTAAEKFNMSYGGEVSDYMYHELGVKALSVELGTQDMGTRLYFPNFKDTLTVLDTYFPFLKDMLFRVGSKLVLSTVYQKIEACEQKHHPVFNCSLASSFVYSAKFRVENHGLTSSESQKVLIKYSQVLSFSNVTVNTKQSEDYVFRDQQFANKNFTQDSNEDIKLSVIDIPAMQPNTTIYIGVVGTLPSQTVQQSYISLEVLYYKGGDDSECLQEPIRDKGVIVEPKRPKIDSHERSSARVAQDIILAAYFTILAIIGVGVGIRKLCKLFTKSKVIKK